jgi:hypothetical protein
MAAVAENVHIETGAIIGACAVILPYTYVGPDVLIKPNATVGGDGYENAVIRGLFLNILPVTPLDPRFWEVKPVSRLRNPNESKILRIRTKKM